MKITPTRTMRLGGQRVEAGKPVDVPDDVADLALRHGWAVKVARAERAPKADPASADKV